MMELDTQCFPAQYDGELQIIRLESRLYVWSENERFAGIDEPIKDEFRV